MVWLRNCVRTAHLLAAVTGCLLTAASATVAARGVSGSRAGTEAALPLQTLLDTVALGSTATYQHLGLRAGAGVQLFYATNAYQPVWTQATGWNGAASQALGWLARAYAYGLSPGEYELTALLALPDSLRRGAQPPGPCLAGFELRLTDALLRFAAHLQHGRLWGNSLVPRPEEPTALTAALRLHSALSTGTLPAFITTSQPCSRAYVQLLSAWQDALAAACPEDSVRLLSGEQAWFRRVAINLERLRWEAAPDSEYAEVNIPAYSLQLVRQGQVVQTHRVVVGKPDMPTPTLNSRITEFVTAPEWRVPHSIAVRELLPEIQRDPSFLADHDYELYNAANRRVNPWRVRWQAVTPETFSYTIRQRAGRGNALGKVVFYFPNRHTVFLHDTPARAVFSRSDRALSHGCVRVENPLALAAYLAGRQGQQAALRAALTGPDRHAKHVFTLAKALPVHFRYYTCIGGLQGQLRLYPDVYNQDPALLTALFGL